MVGRLLLDFTLGGLAGEASLRVNPALTRVVNPLHTCIVACLRYNACS
jgi:hypothetical protein